MLKFDFDRVLKDLYLSEMARKVSKLIEARKALLSAGERIDRAFAGRFAADTRHFEDELAAARGDGQRLRALRRALRQRGQPQLKNCIRRAGTVPLPQAPPEVGTDTQALQASA